ncbi:thermostable hemolysin [Streptomyces roseifaciens]|uniref:thermostable hemolysin n=1 Tax=Streptomyces roseifaciens TaxID=1488406 RepID=UPI000717E6DD|nr:thermostable hemolysin [Streptomyces roseifaciens]
MHISVAARLSQDWSAASDFVRARYERAYGADILPDPDCFVIARKQEGRGGRIIACGGLTFNSDRGFFSERYLDRPVDEVVGAATGEACDREDLVEVGSLAGGGGAGLELVRLLPILSWCHGMRFLMCTVTTELAQTLDRVGIEFQPLAESSADRLTEFERQRWGTYYDHRPMVGVIRLEGISHLFSQTTGKYNFTNLQVALRGERNGKELAHAAR